MQKLQSAGQFHRCGSGLGKCLAGLGATIISTAACAQIEGCGAWLPADALPGWDSTASMLLEWDRDGAGPASREIIAVGGFQTAGAERARGIASWDGARWHAIGGQQDPNDAPSITAVAVAPNGDLLAAGSFTSIGGVPAVALARWNGSIWTAVGDSPRLEAPGSIHSIAVSTDGTIYVAADRGILRKRAGGWDRLSTEYATGVVAGPGGVLYAYGGFTRMGGTEVRGFARWNGSGWEAVGGGLGASGEHIQDVALLGDGSIVVCGQFATIGGVAARAIARWDGARWSAMPSLYQPMISRVQTIGGRLVIFGDFGVDGDFNRGFAELDGEAWRRLSYPADLGRILEAADGRLFAPRGTDMFTLENGEWVPAGGADIIGSVYALASNAGGETIAAGAFTYAGSARVNNIAVHRNDMWEPLGEGLPNRVNDVLTLRDGRVLAAMTPATTGGTYTSSVMEWDGTAWREFGRPLTNGIAYKLEELPDGSVVCGGTFYGAGNTPYGVLKWTGTRWDPLASLSTGLRIQGVSDLAIALEGSLFAAGSIITTSGTTHYIARWNGTDWVEAGQRPTSTVSGLTTLPSGDLAAFGEFRLGGLESLRFVCRWDGRTWTQMAPGSTSPVYQLGVTSRGAIYAVINRAVNRLEGGAWVPVSTPSSSSSTSNPTCMLVSPDDELHFGFLSTRAFLRWSEAATEPLAASLTTDTPIVSRDSDIVLRTIVGGTQPYSIRWEIEGADGWRQISGTTVWLDGEEIGWVLTGGSDAVFRTFYHDLEGRPIRFRSVVQYSPCDSVSTEPVSIRICIADFNQDGEVDWADLVGYVEAWDRGAGVDLTGDFGVDADDLTKFISRWENGC